MNSSIGSYVIYAIKLSFAMSLPGSLLIFGCYVIKAGEEPRNEASCFLCLQNVNFRSHEYSAAQTKACGKCIVDLHITHVTTNCPLHLYLQLNCTSTISCYIGRGLQLNIQAALHSLYLRHFYHNHATRKLLQRQMCKISLLQKDINLTKGKNFSTTL